MYLCGEPQPTQTYKYLAYTQNVDVQLISYEVSRLTLRKAGTVHLHRKRAPLGPISTKPNFTTHQLHRTYSCSITVTTSHARRMSHGSQTLKLHLFLGVGAFCRTGRPHFVQYVAMIIATLMILTPNSMTRITTVTVFGCCMCIRIRAPGVRKLNQSLPVNRTLLWRQAKTETAFGLDCGSGLC